MKFIEDYLTELFGVAVCDVRLNYAEPTNIIASYSFADVEYKAYRGGRETIAEECRRLGGFCVGKEVFKCVRISEHIKEINDE